MVILAVPTVTTRETDTIVSLSILSPCGSSGSGRETDDKETSGGMGKQCETQLVVELAVIW